jgi:hypothetical protein
MQIHPHIASALAAERMAHFHESASASPHATSAREAERRVELSPGNGSIRLDAYPRLCGLPVTVERHSMDLELPPGADTDTTDADVVNDHQEDTDVHAFDHRVSHEPRARRRVLGRRAGSRARVGAAGRR